MSNNRKILKQSSDDIAEYIKMSARRAGFDLVGVVDVDEIASSDYLLAMTNSLNEWVKNGYHAEMKWFADTVEKRKDILKVMPDAKSVICVAMNYYRDTNIRMNANDTNNTNKKNAVGKIARYALGKDYHKIFDKKLKLFVRGLEEDDKDWIPVSTGMTEEKLEMTQNGAGMTNAKFKYYCDTGPISERMWATQAGLGFIGKNTNLITKYGSWVLLGEIITNIAISDERLAVSQLTAFNSCGSCRRCLDACPTGALIALPAGRQGPYTVDARKCISYLTIEHKGEIPMELREKMGNRIFGCDACQEVCPFNIGRQKEGLNFKAAQDKHPYLSLRRYSVSMTDMKKEEKEEKKRVEEFRGNYEIELQEILSIKTDEEFLKKISPPFERTVRSVKCEDCNQKKKSSKQVIADTVEEVKASALRAGFAGTPLMRAKRRGLVRNACIAAGNSGDLPAQAGETLLPYLKECLKDQEPIIVEAAQWAVKKLKNEI